MAMEIDGFVVRRLRERSGWSQRALALRCDGSPGTISRLEALGDAAVVSERTAKRVADALGVDVDDLRCSLTGGVS